MRLAMKFGVSLARHHAFAQPQIANFIERGQNFRPRLRPGNQLDQFHVARRIEKMRSRPVLLKILRAAFGDQMNRQAGSIRGDDCAGLAHRFDAREEFALDLQVLGDRFDDPIHFAAPIEIVFEISERDQARRIGSKKCRGTRFLGRFEPGQHDAIAHRRAFQRQPFAVFLGVQLGRDHIQQVARNSGIRQMRGDARAHGSRAENGRFFDSSFVTGFLYALRQALRLQKRYRAVNRKDPQRRNELNIL